LEISKDFATDVFWLSFQSVVDAFQFHHWKEGVAVRSFVYGCFVEERIWERVEGYCEPWEKTVFFDPKELERIWREEEIAIGSAEPGMDARECAWKIAEYYEFPGWA
jgi:hypothetical protein